MKLDRKTMEARKVRSKLKSMKSEVNQTPKEESGSFDDRCTKARVTGKFQ